MNEIKKFSNSKFGELRVALFEGKEMFCLSDVCKALGLINVSRVKSRLSERGVTIMNTPTQNQFGTVVMQPMTYIDEPNLYRCIFQSRKESAVQFQDWVVEEILPTIRQTGGYLNVSQTMTEQEMLAQALLVAQRTIDLRNERIAQQQLQLEEQQPKVEFFDAVGESDDVISIDQLAKLMRQNGIDIGERRLFKWLRQEKFLGSFGNHYNIPNQRYISQGLLTIEEQQYEVNGRTHLAQRPRVTGKGQEYFLNGFLTGRFSL